MRAAGRRAIPEPEVIVGTKSSTALGGDVGSVLSIQAVIPLFDRGRPERALAAARASRAEAQLDGLRLRVRADVAALRAAVVERRAAADRYRAAAASSAQVERIAEVSYEAGERGILELLDAYRSASIAQIRQTMLDAAARRAEIELEYVSGWEIP
jgi:cobalt-zinc-cadmium efflux system outer membrane protein